MKVLVVDDNRALANVIRDILEDEGMEVRTACDGREGYAAYLRFKPDLILTDIQMPGVNGLEMMTLIRNHDPLVRTIYMSGAINAFRSSLDEEKERYPVSCFEKPFSLDVLTMLISRPDPDRRVEPALAASAC